ncbi:MAG: DMT family protein [Oligoflexia bacterium]|nr:DMT family protein [Oligoflexia bacterium]
MILFRTVGLLFLSNCFMTLAWYGHLRFKSAPLLLAILGSWLLALPEYGLQVPANRYGHGELSAYQLKILQECITLVVFMGFAWFGLNEPPRMNHLIAFGLIIAAVVVAFR